MKNQSIVELEILNKENKESELIQHSMVPRKKIRRNIITIIIVSLTALAYGLGLNSVIVEFQASKKLSPDIKAEDFNSIYGVAAALLLAGGAFGHILFNFFESKRFSKKKFLLIGSIINLVSFVSIYFYPHVYFIGAARFFMGINAGFAGAIVPGVIHQLAPEKARGFFGALYPGFITLGLLIGQILSYFSSSELFYIPHSILCMIFAIQTLLLFLIDLNNDEAIEDNKSILETIRSKECRKSLLISIIFHVSQHLSGIDFVALFANDILQMTSHPYIFGIVNFSIGVTLTCLSGWLCDLGGRKIFFITSCLATAVAIGCMNFLNFQHIVLGVFFVTFNLGLGNIPWMILGEIFPNPYAKSGNFIAVLANWCAAFGITVFSKLLFDFFGNMVYNFFSLSMVLTALFTMISFKETRNQVEPRFQ